MAEESLEIFPRAPRDVPQTPFTPLVNECVLLEGSHVVQHPRLKEIDKLGQ
jgi:hypothetical protein